MLLFSCLAVGLGLTNNLNANDIQLRDQATDPGIVSTNAPGFDDDEE